MQSRPLRILTIPLLALCVAACSSDGRPPVAPSADDPGVRTRVVDPVIEKWFRTNVPPSGMRLLPGDQISITVQGHDDLKVTRYVPPNGEIPIYDTDKVVRALGKTLQQLEEDIARAYTSKFEKAPYVTVAIAGAAPRSISVIGGVKTQGVFPVSGNERLTVLQAIALAGGALPQSDLRNVTLQRIYPETGETVSSPFLDIRKVMEEGGQRDNLIVEPGDTIVVPDLQESNVQLFGMVEHQGPVVWHEGMTLLEAITEAGGLKKFAKTSAVKVVRRGRDKIVINIDEIIDRVIPDFVLEPRDVIYVGERFF